MSSTHPLSAPHEASPATGPAGSLALTAPRAGLPPVSVLMYHQVGRFPKPSAHKAAFCHVDRFRAQMAWLHAARYPVISLDALHRGLFGDGTLPARAVVLTFDDGYENFAEHAFPVLERYGFPSAVFAVTGQLGGEAGWLDGSFEPARLMPGASLRRLADRGVTIGSHTVSHPRLPKLDAAAMRREVFDSKAALEDVLGRAVPDFCYPYGAYDARVRDAAREAGYRLALTCLRGSANVAANAWEIPRKAISFGDNVLGYIWKLHMKHELKGRFAQDEADSYA